VVRYGREYASERRRTDMTIDDVLYLQQNGEEDSMMVFVDSATRDYTFYPTPSDYVVNFDEPIKMVTGLDVLDASIPASMYNVDTDNNMVKLFTWSPGFGYADGPMLPETFMAEMGQLGSVRAYLDRLDDKKVAIVTPEQIRASWCATCTW